MKTSTANLCLAYAANVALLCLWQGTFLALSLVVPAVARIRRELRAEGECIEPLWPIIARLDTLHDELCGRFGIED